MSALDAVARSGTLEPIDLHFARLIRRQAGQVPPDDAEVVTLTAALVSRQRGRGHSCIDPRDWAGRPFPTEGGGPATPPLPELAAWRRVLDASPLVSDGTVPSPLVHDGDGRVYLRRYWLAEQRLAGALRRRLESPPPAVDPGALAPLFRRLFPEPRADPSDGQAIAAATALAGRLALISGGPGTGKTTTVGRLLALWLAAEPDLRVALAAPTGKAAARLGEAVAEQAARLPIDEALSARFPAGASTLHRLLGYRPGRDRFRHHAGRPLVLDALVIDEVSMVDLLLMDATFDALPAEARVVLLGDKDQLTSVETGSVFGDLCAAAGSGAGRSKPFAELFHALSGRRPPACEPVDAKPSGLLRHAAALLTTSYRFRDRPGIGELATAVRHGDASSAASVLDDPDRPEAARLEPPADAGAALAPVTEALERYLAAESPAQALERLGGFRVLCARRRGPWGAVSLNTAVERYLAAHGHPVGASGSPRRGASGTLSRRGASGTLSRRGASGAWYRARPILITANDYQVRLFNGDLGVCWPDAARPDEAGRLWAFFPAAGDEPRRLPLARLPAHETAWAMTVHKAQGSEFDRVLLVLGDTDTRVATRDLLYTGATRARRSVVIVATPEILRAAVARRVRRVSGLASALAGMPATGTPATGVPATGMPATGMPATGTPADIVRITPEPDPDADPEPPNSEGPGQMSLFS